MKTCPYCGSGLKSFGHDFYCGYCELKLCFKDVQENGKRKSFLPDSQPTHDDLKRSTPELMTVTTIELLFLLKFARAERSSIYGQRNVFIKALKTGNTDFKEGEQYTFGEYEYWTRKCFVLENLIRERIGYVPAKLTESYLQSLADRMIESTKKDMVIQQPRPINS
ncbi:hypothetical protein [Neobacillus drentensis]|jgi:hypothetical protein|uniref:hypothetical protein n=1 Tax=Neobacillus drentensis TaxID=220684 RepID=UPI000BF43AFC|nr:hypothetical protein CN481_16100 [Bacillus sp. AFS006103]